MDIVTSWVESQHWTEPPVHTLEGCPSRGTAVEIARRGRARTKRERARENIIELFVDCRLESRTEACSTAESTSYVVPFIHIFVLCLPCSGFENLAVYQRHWYSKFRSDTIIILGRPKRRTVCCKFLRCFWLD